MEKIGTGEDDERRDERERRRQRERGEASSEGCVVGSRSPSPPRYMGLAIPVAPRWERRRIGEILCEKEGLAWVTCPSHGTSSPPTA